MVGFYVKRLMVVGENKEAAQITFQKGLNVIHGPSNTGKSYVFQCINYAFGASNIKAIPESEGYTHIYLEIRGIDNDEPITILRLFNKTDIFYYYCNIDEIDKHNFETLKSKHSPDSDDNISKFLLKQIGIDKNKYLVKNQNGEKITLGFRAIAHLSLISETDIISEAKSPILETQKTQQTYSKSVFRYLLTNQDDLDCEELEKPEIKKAKYEAKIDYIREEIILLTQEKEKLISDKEDFALDGINSLDYYKEKIMEIQNIINSKRQELHNINSANNRLNLRKNKSHMMLDKFELLKRQYLSDMERLDFTAIGNSLLSQIVKYHCPLCDNEVLNEADVISQDDIANCCNMEKAKIQINLIELENSMRDLSEDFLQIDIMLSEGTKKSLEYSKEIAKISDEDLKPLKEVIKVLIEQSKIENRILDLGNTIERKRGEIITFEESKKVREDSVTDKLIVNQQIYKDLCVIIKNSLVACGYTGVEKVSFDVKTQDIEIDGKHRLSNGKGYRAFFYAVFSAALMIYLKNAEHYYTRVLVLDSPLTTLKESEILEASEDDFVNNSLQDGLFTFLANNYNDMQVIILENKQPPKGLLGKYNEIAFTKGLSEGRYGFFKKV